MSSDDNALDLEPESAGAENDDDLRDVEGRFSNVVLAPSDWAVETVLGLHSRGEFELDPEFQRRSAWNDSRKSKFIESLIVGLPVPQIVLAEDRSGGRQRFIVIDGKQRLLTLAAFFSGGFKLTGLDLLDELNKLSFAEIEADPGLSKYISWLRTSTIRTVVIRNYPNSDFLHLVFHRLNHQTLPLSAQELRQALAPGAFTTWADRFAADSTLLNGVLGSTEPDFRMRDVELLVRYISFQRRIEDYRGNLKKFLDETCSIYNTSWAEEEEEIRSLGDTCESSIELTRSIFGVDAFRRFAKGKFETRFNRAVFDIMTYYFSDEVVAAAAKKNPDVVKAAFKNLSARKKVFSDALTVGTKTPAATVARFGQWGAALGDALDLTIPVPKLKRSGEIEIK